MKNKAIVSNANYLFFAEKLIKKAYSYTNNKDINVLKYIIIKKE